MFHAFMKYICPIVLSIVSILAMHSVIYKKINYDATIDNVYVELIVVSLAVIVLFIDLIFNFYRSDNNKLQTKKRKSIVDYFNSKYDISAENITYLYLYYYYYEMRNELTDVENKIQDAMNNFNFERFLTQDEIQDFITWAEAKILRRIDTEIIGYGVNDYMCFVERKVEYLKRGLHKRPATAIDMSNLQKFLNDTDNFKK